MSEKPSALQREIRQNNRSGRAATRRWSASADHGRGAPPSRCWRPYGITLQQYNVLRISRGAGAEGLATPSIAERMIEATPHHPAPRPPGGQGAGAARAPARPPAGALPPPRPARSADRLDEPVHRGDYDAVAMLPEEDQETRSGCWTRSAPATAASWSPTPATPNPSRVYLVRIADQTTFNRSISRCRSPKERPMFHLKTAKIAGTALGLATPRPAGARRRSLHHRRRTLRRVVPGPPPGVAGAGQLQRVPGQDQHEPRQPGDLQGEFRIKAASIDTQLPDRDKHLRAPDFF